MWGFPVYFLFLAAIYSDGFLPCSAAKLPADFPRCKLDDPKLNECMTNAVFKAITVNIKDGIPSLQTLPTDPLEIDYVDIQEGGNRPVNIKLSFSNAKLSGLSQMTVPEVKFDPVKRRINALTVMPLLSLEGDYELGGKILQIPLRGKGKSKLTLGPVKANVDILADVMTKKGEVYWDMKQFGINLFDAKSFKMHFENLFNGDKVLGEATKKAINENWEAVFQELKPALEQTFGEVFRRVGNGIFSKVPEKDLFLQ